MTVQQDAITAGASFFTPAANTKPYFKVAAQGFAGSGKTYTLFKIAMALLAQVRKHDPAAPNRIVFFDTEKASGFLRPLAEGAGIELMVKESRSLRDLTEAITICENGYATVMLVDSISHVYENFLEAYKQAKKKTRLEIQDWGFIKPRWKSDFSERFVRSRVHILFTGRAGYEYEAVEVERDNGTTKKEFHKAGVKMKVDGETAYEPDLLIHMERFEELLDGKKKRVWREATILKDRSGLIDGRTFENPDGSEFSPVIEYLLTKPSDAVQSPEGDDRGLFDESDAGERAKLERTILLESIEALIVQLVPGQAAKDKVAKVQLLVDHFGTRSWREVEVSRLERLREGKRALEVLLSKAQQLAKDAAAEGLDPEPLPGGVALDRRASSTDATDATATSNGNGEAGKDAPGTDAAVALSKPLSDVERARMRKACAKALGARGFDAAGAARYLTDETGRAVDDLASLTDAELSTVHAKLITD